MDSLIVVWGRCCVGDCSSWLSCFGDGLCLWKGVGGKQGTVGNKMGNEWLGKGKLEMREVTRNSTC